MALSKESRLRRSVDVRRVLAEGKTRVSPLAAFYWLCRGDGAQARVAFIASRRVGKAVERNRVRRRLREIMRSELPHVRCPVDMVIVARRESAAAPFTELKRQVVGLLARAGLRQQEPGPGSDSAQQGSKGREL